MTELSRSLLAAAREGLAPDPDAAARVRARVAAAVAAGTAAATGSHAVAASTAPSATTGGSAAASAPAAAGGPVAAAGADAPIVAARLGSAAPAAATGSSSFALKVGAALLVVGVSSAIVVVGRDAERVPEVPQLSLPTHLDDVSARVHVAAPNEPLALSDEPLAQPDEPAPRPRPVAPSASHARVEATVPPAPVSAIERPPATLSREVELIDLAMVSLRKNAPRAAIEAIRVFERETFGQGQMAEEAAAIEIEARCTLREDVTAALADFDLEWPESAQRERIQTTCFARK